MLRSLLSAILLLTPAVAQVTVLQNARIIDGSGGAPIEKGVIVISKGRIQAMGPASSVKAPANADVLDLSGKTIIPGIINLHGHVGATKGLQQDASFFTMDNIEANLRTYAMYGVTSTTSMGSDANDLILRVQKREADGQFLGTHVYTALQGFTVPGGYPTQAPGMKGVALEISTAAQARAKVDDLAKRGANFIKMWVDSHHGKMKKLPPDLYAAIIDQAHKNKLPAFAHVYELGDAKGLVKANIDMLAHSIRDAIVDDEFLTIAKTHNITAVSTLAREVSTYAYADDPDWLNDPFFTRSVSPEVQKALKTSMKDAQKKDPERDINMKGVEIALKNLKKMWDAGIRIGFGTDSGPPGRFPGFSEHLEMELMVKAGLTPMQVIQSFSKNAAEGLRISKDYGVLAKGKVADLVVLDKNPLENVRNCRAIHAVYIDGKKFM